MYANGMLSIIALPLLVQAQETVVGLYIFHRHGDRTAKALPPANLTTLGWQEVYTSGTWFRNQYIASNATLQIVGVNPDIVKETQITVSAPNDVVLDNSAQGFLQALYPGPGLQLARSVLRNGTVIEPPMNGVLPQLIPVGTTSTGAGSEDNTWLQAATGCNNAVLSSNQYLYSPEYVSLLNYTTAFYEGIAPYVATTYNASQTTFKNAYSGKSFHIHARRACDFKLITLPVFDLINVAEIHNQTFDPNNTLTADQLLQLRTLADTHEFNLAYNASSTIRAIAGMQLAAEVVQFLNDTINGAGKSKIGIQFGAYGTFQSFFGLANLTAKNPMFYGIPDYASTMTFELFTTGPATPFPNASALNVRFLWHNGTTSDSSTPQPFSLFKSTADSMPWNDFEANMASIAVGDTRSWCNVCGNTTGACAAYQTSASTVGNSSPSSTTGRSAGLSLTDAGVIGAFTTIGVMLLAAGILFASGFRLVSRSRVVESPAASVSGRDVKA